MLNAAVEEALAEMAKSDPLHFRRGEIDLTLIKQKLSEKGVVMWSTRTDFVSKLVDAPAFRARYRAALFVSDSSDRFEAECCA
jgi:hypothetical protein